jgi:hypothetical protein
MIFVEYDAGRLAASRHDFYDAARATDFTAGSKCHVG